MTDINQVCFVGRVTHDIGERDFGYAGETAKLNLSVACNRSKKSGEEWVDEVSYFDVQIFGSRAESLKNYINKGKQICVDGYLKQERWMKDGEKKSRVVIVANNIQLLGGKEENAPQKEEKPNFMPQNMKNFKSAPKQNDAVQEDIPW